MIDLSSKEKTIKILDANFNVTKVINIDDSKINCEIDKNPNFIDCDGTNWSLSMPIGSKEGRLSLNAELIDEKTAHTYYVSYEMRCNGNVK